MPASSSTGGKLHVIREVIAVILWLGIWFFAWDYPYGKGMEKLREARAKTPPRDRDFLAPLVLMFIGFCFFVLGIAALFIGFSAAQVVAWLAAALFLGAAAWLWRHLRSRWSTIRPDHRWGEAATLVAGMLLFGFIAITILVVAL